MNDRPRDDDAHDASDWLASQFNADERPEVPSGGTVPPSAPSAPTDPPRPAAPASDPPAADRPATAPPTSAAPASAAPAGGFSWGLRPGAATTPPAPVPPEAAAPTPPPLIEPSEPAPTVAWTPPRETPPAAVPPAAVPPAATAPASVAPAATPPAETAPPPSAGSWDVPTQLMGAVPSEHAAPETANAQPGPAHAGREPVETEPLTASELAATERLGSAAVAQDAATTSALESLFADENFHDYEAEPLVAAPSPRRPAADRSAGDGQISRTQKILLGVAGGLVALLALAALFLLGTRLPDLIGPAAAPLPSSTPTPSPTPVATELPLGPVDPGVWAWDELLGGECLDDYDDPWAEEFTVVDCAEPHPAQLVFRGVFPPSAEGVTNDPFPGTETLHAQIPALCSAPGVVDLAVAGQYTDVQIAGSYPATAEQWDAGERSYFCFVTRSSGEPLTGTLAVPPPPPADDEAEG